MRWFRSSDVTAYLRGILTSVPDTAKQAAVAARDAPQDGYRVGRYLVTIACDDAVASGVGRPLIAVTPALATHHGREAIVAAVLIDGGKSVNRTVSDTVTAAFARSLGNASSTALSARLADATRAAERAYINNRALRIHVACAGVAVTPVGVEWSVAGGASIAIRRGAMQSRLTRTDGASDRSPAAMPLQSGDELVVCGRDATPRLRFSIAERFARELGYPALE